MLCSFASTIVFDLGTPCSNENVPSCPGRFQKLLHHQPLLQARTQRSFCTISHYSRPSPLVSLGQYLFWVTWHVPWQQVNDGKCRSARKITLLIIAQETWFDHIWSGETCFPAHSSTGPSDTLHQTTVGIMSNAESEWVCNEEHRRIQFQWHCMISILVLFCNTSRLLVEDHGNMKLRFHRRIHSINVDKWDGLGQLFELWEIPTDCRAQDMMWLCVDTCRVLWLWLLLKVPECREVFTAEVMMGAAACPNLGSCPTPSRSKLWTSLTWMASSSSRWRRSLMEEVMTWAQALDVTPGERGELSLLRLLSLMATWGADVGWWSVQKPSLVLKAKTYLLETGGFWDSECDRKFLSSYIIVYHISKIPSNFNPCSCDRSSMFQLGQFRISFLVLSAIHHNPLLAGEVTRQSWTWESHAALFLLRQRHAVQSTPTRQSCSQMGSGRVGSRWGLYVLIFGKDVLPCTTQSLSPEICPSLFINFHQFHFPIKSGQHGPGFSCPWILMDEMWWSADVDRTSWASWASTPLASTPLACMCCPVALNVALNFALYCFGKFWETSRHIKTHGASCQWYRGAMAQRVMKSFFPVLHWSILHYTQDFPGNPRTSKVQLSMAHLLGTLDRLDSLVLSLYPFTSYIASIHVFFWPKRECEKHPKIWWLLRQPCESTQKKWCHLTRKMYFGWHNWIETHMDSGYPIGSSSCCSGPNNRSVAMILFLLLPCRC